MFRDTLVKELSSGEKKWLAQAIASIIIADQKVGDDEIKHLKDAWTYLETKEEVEELVSYVKKKNMPPLKPLVVKPRLGVMMLVYLIRSAVSDAKMAELEYKELDSLAVKLGIFGDLKNKILKWALDLSKLNRQVIDFLELAENYNDQQSQN